MKVYSVEFRASLEVAAEDEHAAACYATSAIFAEPKMIYIESINKCGYRSAWTDRAPRIDPEKDRVAEKLAIELWNFA